jgi:hypothetical protein
VGLHGVDGDLNRCGFLAGDAEIMKIETPLGKPAV